MKKLWNKFTSLFRRAPKRVSATIAIVAAAIIVPVALFAWGPDRATYTIENPADHVTFNSITNNPNYGDERNFVTIKDATNTSAGGWVDEINVESGKEYWVRMYVHNNAAENLNLVATNTTAKFYVPTDSAKSVTVNGLLSASNANPGTIWDQAIFKSTDNFNLAYVAGSATYTNNVFTGGTALADSVVGSGALLGYDKLDGNIPGCFKYSGYVIIKVKATQPNFTVSKQVRAHADDWKTGWAETVSVDPGTTVDYLIAYKNTGSTTQNNVVISDVLPTGLTYVAGTTYIKNVNHPNGDLTDDGIATEGGLNIGNYTAGSNAYVKFSAKVADNDALANCGENAITNTASVRTDNGTKTDPAEVKATKTCTPDTPVTPVTPTVLPQTGAGENIVAFIGIAALIASITAFYRSGRRTSNLKAQK